MANCKHCGKADTTMPPLCHDCAEKLQEVTLCKDCVHYNETGECDVHTYDGRFSRTYFCADAEIGVKYDDR